MNQRSRPKDYRLYIILLILALLTALCLLSASLTKSNKGWSFVPFNLHSVLQADYSARPLAANFPAVELAVIQDALRDRGSATEGDAEKIEQHLNTPVPFFQPAVTPGLLDNPTSNPTAIPFPTATNSNPFPSADPGGVPTSVGTATPESTITPTWTGIFPTETPWQTSLPVIQPTRTFSPTRSVTDTAAPPSRTPEATLTSTHLPPTSTLPPPTSQPTPTRLPTKTPEPYPQPTANPYP